MRLIVAIEARFCVVGGQAYSSYLTYESFWKRYLDVFDSVLIVARATDIEKVPKGHQIATADRVKIAALPQYFGPYQFVRKMFRIRNIIREALRPDDACILRVPGNIGTQLYQQLPPSHPFGVEVISIPWDGFAPGAVKSITRPFFRRLLHYNLRKQCRHAVAAAYVTEHAIQRFYPPGESAFTTHYSSKNMDSKWILANPHERLARTETIPERLAGNGPAVRLGFIGSFSQGHKRPDIHIQAVAQCVAQGANVRLEMIGDGSMVPSMKKLAQRLGIADRVVFRGRIPGGKPVFDALDTFDLFINATASEGLPRVVIEAMARGCLCIGSDIGGIPELIEPDLLAPVCDSAALADKIIEVLKNPKRMRNVVLRNINHARNYCNDVLQPRRRAFYQALLERTEKHLSEKP